MTKQNTKQNKQTAEQKAQAELKRIKYTDSKDKAAVDKAIADAVAKVRGGRVAVQKAAVQVLVHAYHHGDYSKATALVEALGNGINAGALVEWFKQFGGLRTRDGEPGFIAWSGREHIAANLDAAKSTPWWTCKKQNPWGGFDLQNQLERLLRQAERAANKVQDEPDLKDKVNLQVDADIQQRVLHLLGRTA